MSLRLQVLTPSRVVVDVETESVTAPGELGQLGVLPEHAAFLGVLEVGVLTYVDGGKAERIMLTGGFAEVRDDMLTVMADEAFPAREIDPEAARRGLAEARAAVKTGADTPEEVDRLLATLRSAEARVEAIT